MQLFYTILKVISTLRMLAFVYKVGEALQQMLLEVGYLGELVAQEG